MNQIKVQFIGEPAVDQGGPSREYFGLINEAAQRKLMAKSVFRHNISAFTRREYYAFWATDSHWFATRITRSKMFYQVSV